MTDICDRCHRPASSGSDASITQWVFTCKCDLLDRSELLAESVEICQQCGKEKLSNRHGSFTQWVFRKDSCRCDVKSGAGRPSNRQDEKSKRLVEEVKAQIELPADQFPIDRYEPLEQLGSGATGEVYLCRDRLLKKKVALKRLQVLSSDLLMQFQNEARLVSKLDHPNIIKILDFGVTEAGLPFMVLEYFDGLSLRNWIDEMGVLQPTDACVVVSELCHALAYAHEQGVLHRDVTSNNVLIVSPDGWSLKVKVIDFGIAKIRQSQADTQGKDTIAGSPLYMSADQARGLPYDERSEVYSIGCIFFELLTGRVPLEGDTALETIGMHAHAHPPTASDVLGEPVPEQIETILARCLEKAPDRRFQSIGDLGLEVRSFLESGIDESEMETDPASQPIREKSGFSLKLVSVSCIAIAIVLAFFFFAIQREPENKVKEVKVPALHGKGILREFKAKKGTFLEGQNENGEMYTYPVDFLECSDEQIAELRGKDIKILAFWNCPINGSGFKYLEKVPLETLNLAGSEIEEENLSLLVPLKDTLQELLLGRTLVSAKGLRLLGASTRLRRLQLNMCSRIDDRAIEVIADQFPNLETLSIPNTSIGSGGIRQLASLSKLHALNLEGTAFSDTDMSSLTGLKLYVLNLSRCKVTDKGLLELRKLKTLRELKLRNCSRVTRAGVARLRRTLPGLAISH